MSADVALFELEAPVEDRWWERVVRQHVIHSTDVDRRYYCGADEYGYLEGAPERRDAWLWHCCTQPVGHIGLHVCDRCDQTWDGPAAHHLTTAAEAAS